MKSALRMNRGTDFAALLSEAEKAVPIPAPVDLSPAEKLVETLIERGFTIRGAAAWLVRKGALEKAPAWNLAQRLYRRQRRIKRWEATQQPKEVQP